MLKSRIAVLLLVATLMFLLYQIDQQAKIIEQQKQEIRMLWRNSN